jgi:hypothetical protein
LGKLLSTLAGLLSLAALGWAQKPSNANAEALIEKSRQTTLAYLASLPDFVCTEVISRYREGARARTSAGSWIPLDKLTVKLSYFQQRERHQLVLVNGIPTSLTYDSLDAGAITSGEFGGILKSIFDPASQASFHWEGWKNERGHRVAVFTFEVDAAHSNYYLGRRVSRDDWEVVEGRIRSERSEMRRAIVGYHGTVEIDSETGEVLHFDHVADRIPTELAYRRAATTVDYDFAGIAGRKYLLPSHSVTELSGTNLGKKNESEFREYGKFEAFSSVEFGTGK